VIPTVSARAIETAGTERASLVSGVTFMCQLAGSAVMLAVNTAIFAAVGASAFRQAAAGLNLSADQTTAVLQILTGAPNIHAIPGVTAADVAEIAPLVASAYASGLQVVLWIGAALLLVAVVLVALYVPSRDTKASVN
jgi:hypothetical protein